MNIDTKKIGTELTVSPEGSIDTVTAPDLEQELKTHWDGITELILDFSDVSFISSAGIRVILWAHKQMSGQGKMVLKNIHEDVREVFVLTGLDTALNFE